MSNLKIEKIMISEQKRQFEQIQINFYHAAKDQPKIIQRFFDFHAKNPKIYDHFKKFVCELLGDKPNRTIGAQMIIERIRYEVFLYDDHSEQFKLPNEFAPAYARMFMQLNPQYNGLINTRSSIFDDYFSF